MNMLRSSAWALLVATSSAGCGLLLGIDDFKDAGSGGGGGGQGGEGGAAPCEPGAMAACYSGPDGTEGVGICRAGATTCDDQGQWGACAGEVPPAPVDDCFTSADENCDGLACGDVLWSRRYGDPSSQVVFGVVTAADGDSVLTGRFQGTLELGRLPPLTPIGNFGSFLVKIDASGTPIWQKGLLDPAEPQITSIVVDDQNGIFAAGYSDGAMDLGDGCSVLPAGMFVFKLGPSGACQWARNYSGAGAVASILALTPGSGELVVAGTTYINLDIGGTTLTNKGGGDVFVAKLDPQNGSRIWAKIYGSTGDQECNGLALDANGSIVVAGAFTGELDMAEMGGAGKLTSWDASKDVFVAKLQPGGAPTWSKSFGFNGDDVARSVAVDSSNNVIVGGDFLGSLNFGGTADPMIAVGPDEDAFVAKISSGGMGIWARRYGDEEYQAVSRIAVDAGDNVVVVGVFDGTMSLGGPDLVHSANGGGFLAKLTSNGGHVWSKGFGNTRVTFMTGVAVDRASNQVITTAVSTGEVNFGDGALTAAGDNGTYDIFVARFAL